MLSKLFLLDTNEKLPKIKIKNLRSSLSYIKGETKKEYEIRLLENKLNNNKLKIKKDYLDKLSLLLHDSFKYKDYYFKRNNINKIIYKYNENNELRLILNEFLSKSNNNIFHKKEIKNKNNCDDYNNEKYILEDIRSDLILTPIQSKNNLLEDEKMNKKNEQTDFNSNIIHKKKQHFFGISNDIIKILYNNEDKISLSEQKNIYNRFKKKYPYFRHKLNKQLNIQNFNSEKRIKYSNLGQKFFVKNHKLNMNLMKNDNLSLENLLKTANELRILRDKIKINKSILSEENILKEIKKESISTSPITKIKKKLILMPYEMFYYDTKKWKKIKNSKKDGKDEKYFNKIDKEIDDTINEMKNKVINLNQEISKLEETKNKMKSQRKLVAVKSKSFMNFKSQFSSQDVKIKTKFHRQNSKQFYD